MKIRLLYNRRVNRICWLCGKKIKLFQLSMHHVIPTCINPKINVCASLHKKCHKKLNKVYRIHKGFLKEYLIEEAKK